MTESFLDRYRVELSTGTISKIEEQVLPLIRESIDVTLEAYFLDEQYNDGYSIGAYGWRNAFNRLLSMSNDCGVDVREESPNDLILCVDRLKFRVHKVDPENLLPRGGKAAKKAAKDLQLPLPFIEAPIDSQVNLYVGYVVDPDFGIRKAFIGNMISAELDSDKVYCVPLHTFFDHDAEQIVDSGANVRIPESESQAKQLVGMRIRREEGREGESS